MKKLTLYGWLLIPVLLFAGQSSVEDHPVKGEWNFHPEKIWETHKAGNEDFGRIAELLVSDLRNIFIRDFEHNISYIFDDSGHFLKKFAPQGEEEGQLSRYLNRFLAGEKIVLASPEKLHFFSQTGTFERQIENNLFLRFPLLFLNENEFIYAPNLPQSPVHARKLILFDTRSGKEKTLVDFSDPETQRDNPAPSPMIMIFGLTPQVNLAFDGENVLFGRSDRYEIFTANLSGKILSSFILNRKRMPASLEDKRKHFADLNVPKDTVEKIITQLPDEMTFFTHIDSNNGLVYVFAVTDLKAKRTSLQIDIFSEKGEYMYRGKMAFGNNLKFSSPSNLVFKKDSVYAILENGQGGRTLAKYRITLPPAHR